MGEGDGIEANGAAANGAAADGAAGNGSEVRGQRAGASGAVVAAEPRAADRGAADLGAAEAGADRPAAGLAAAMVRRREGDVFRLVGSLLVVGWAAWFVLLVLTQPRLVTDEQLRSDLAAGEVRAWQVVEVVEDDRDGWAWSPSLVPSTDAQGNADSPATGRESLAYWTTGREHPVRVVDTTGGPVAVSDLGGTLRDAGVAPASDTPGLLTLALGSDAPGLPALLTVVLLLGTLLFGPAPTRGTRWFWFWCLFATMGSGVLAYAVAEHLRRRDAPAESVAGPRRYRGWEGFVAAVLGSLVLSAALVAFADATRWLWAVRP